MTRDLEALCDWLKAAGVTHVGMESTGVYWRPVYAVLEGHFDLIVGNARPRHKGTPRAPEVVQGPPRHGRLTSGLPKLGNLPI